LGPPSADKRRILHHMYLSRINHNYSKENLN